MIIFILFFVFLKILLFFYLERWLIFLWIIKIYCNSCVYFCLYMYVGYICIINNSGFFNIVVYVIIMIFMFGIMNISILFCYEDKLNYIL